MEKLIRTKKTFSTELSFLFGTAETLLNPHIYDIVKYTKEIYPNSKIRLISNGTIPPQKDIVKYIDHFGFSIDGCTANTFEKLRPPAKFSHVLDCLKKWDESAEQFNSAFSLGLGTVVSAENLDELCGIVKLASEFKHIDSVYFQPIILHESRKYLDYLSLSHVPTDKLSKTINQLEKLSQELHVRLDGLQSLVPQETAATIAYDNSNAKYCRYTWNKILPLTENGSLRYFCCYMAEDKMKELLNQYPIPSNLSLEDTYNCSEYWKLRTDMLQGKLTNYCEGCSFVNTGYNYLCQKELDINDTPYV